MNDYVTDEQQAEALKKWWAENGYYLMGGVGLGLGILFGWNYWQDYTEQRSADGSAAYSNLSKAVESQSIEEAVQLRGVLEGDFGSTPYAALGNLKLAKGLVEENKLDEAAARLQWVVDNASEPELVEIATLRKIRVLIAAGKHDEALTALKADLPSSYTAIVEELRGDALVAKGKVDEARVAYDRALLTSGGGSEFLQLKRDALGDAENQGTT